MRKTILIIGAVASSLVVIGTAAAHVGTTPSQAPAGQTTVIGFTIGHGCEGSPTRSVSIRLPAGITSAKPRPKAGWTIQVKRGRLPQPVKDFEGNTIRNGVLEVTWRGNLPDAYYDTFELRLRTAERSWPDAVLPDRPALRTGPAPLDRDPAGGPGGA